MAKLRIAGVIIPNDYKWYYDSMDEDSTCPDDVITALTEANGEELEVEINSPGGEISAGSEIYTLLREYGNTTIKITGMACSAASVIAMAGYCLMSPTALMMIHCVSTTSTGNHNAMEHAAEMLTTADEALANAYTCKTGMDLDDVLRMMEEETWIQAARAVELGLADEILFEEGEG